MLAAGLLDPQNGPGQTGTGMGKISAVLFDKDGTLFDFQRSWAGWALDLLTELSGGNPARRAALAGALGFDLCAARFRPESPVVAGTADDVVRLMRPYLPGWTDAALGAYLTEASAQAPMVPAVDLGPLLSGLAARGLALGVATNDAEAPALAQLEAAGVRRAFDFVAGFDSGHGAKPGPGQVLAFAEATGRRPAEVLMVGDSRFDLAAGRAAGAATAAVLTGTACAEDLSDLAGVVLPDIGALPAYLDRLGAGSA